MLKSRKSGSSEIKNHKNPRLLPHTPTAKELLLILLSFASRTPFQKVILHQANSFLWVILQEKKTKKTLQLLVGRGIWWILKGSIYCFCGSSLNIDFFLQGSCSGCTRSHWMWNEVWGCSSVYKAVSENSLFFFLFFFPQKSFILVVWTGLLRKRFGGFFRGFSLK